MVDTPTADSRGEPDITHINPAAEETWFGHPPAAGTAVHHGNVGAVRLLRHAGAADALSHQALPVRRSDHHRALRRVHRARVSDAADRRAARGSLSRLQAQREVRRDHDGGRLFHALLRRRDRQAARGDRRPALRGAGHRRARPSDLDRPGKALRHRRRAEAAGPGQRRRHRRRCSTPTTASRARSPRAGSRPPATATASS